MGRVRVFLVEDIELKMTAKKRVKRIKIEVVLLVCSCGKVFCGLCTSCDGSAALCAS